MLPARSPPGGSGVRAGYPPGRRGCSLRSPSAGGGGGGGGRAGEECCRRAGGCAPAAAPRWEGAVPPAWGRGGKVSCTKRVCVGGWKIINSCSFGCAGLPFRSSLRFLPLPSSPLPRRGGMEVWGPLAALPFLLVTWRLCSRGGARSALVRRERGS